jgi:zinc and cadmium transporter
MLFQSFLLFIAAFLGGSIVFLIRQPSSGSFNNLLIFSGAYLFAITVLHLLPDLFTLYPTSNLVGLYILIGFFFQLLLEFFSKGVEHGHMYTTQQEGHHHKIAPLALLSSLCIHAFLDGVILSSPTVGHLHHASHSSNGLLLGIILHKIPVAFALTSVLSKLTPYKTTLTLYLLLFALASPLGLWASSYCNEQQWLSEHGLLALLAIVSGNFLHIATTIFFESSPSHHLNIQKFVASLAGAGLAVLLEFL